MRAPGMTWARLPLFVWGHYATSLIQVLGTPVIAITLVLLGLERMLHAGIFDPTLGGDPVLFQHLFWFYSHPAVYIMILPGMARDQRSGGVLFAQSDFRIRVRRLFERRHRRARISGVGPSSVCRRPVDVREHGVSPSSVSWSRFLPPIKVFNWTATMYRGSISFETPMLYAFGFIGLFTIGGLTGLFLATMAVDVHLTDTYFVIAHFHYVMVGGMVMAYLGGIHFWFPKITGRLYPENWASWRR